MLYTNYRVKTERRSLVLNHTILVVDDDTYNLSVAKELLEQNNDIICVTSGKQALAVLSRRMPDLILLDIVMPEMNGFEVISKIKANPMFADIPIIVLTADNDSDTEMKCLELGAEDYIIKPFEPGIMLSRVSRSLELESLRNNLKSVISEKTRRLENMQCEFTREIADIVESRDQNTGGHVQRTCSYVGMLAHSLRDRGFYNELLTDEYIEKLVDAANLHDIGKIKISDIILNKPAKLTSDEFDTMKQHVVYGGEMIEKLLGRIDDQVYFRIAKNIACYHHEKWNGTGYVFGLHGKDIPLEARIMAVADVFDALVSARCYKKPLPHEEAFSIIEESSGSHFDPDVANAFLALKSELK